MRVRPLRGVAVATAFALFFLPDVDAGPDRLSIDTAPSSWALASVTIRDVGGATSPAESTRPADTIPGSYIVVFRDLAGSRGQLPIVSSETSGSGRSIATAGRSEASPRGSLRRSSRR